MNQLQLFTPELSHEQKADAWIEANPMAFKTFCCRALTYAIEGKPVGAKKIIEDLRWSDPDPDQPDQSPGYKWNNNYTATLARRAIEFFPRLRKVLKTRKRKARNDKDHQ